MAIADHSSVIEQVTPILQAPEYGEVLALDPHSFDAATLTNDAAGRFHGFHILGRTDLRDRAEAAAVGELALESIFPWGDWRCVFVPRHALRLHRGDRSVDLVICFECGEVLVRPSPAYRGRIGYRRDGKTQLNAILERAGIKPAD